MQNSPVELLFYYVESLRWKAETGFDPETAPSLKASDLQWKLQRNDDEKEGSRKAAYRLQLTLPSSKNHFPYSFEIVLIGFFHLTEEIADEAVERVLDANAPAILYGAAREALATSIGRGPFRPLLLPSVHFQNIKRPNEKPQKKTLVKASAKKSTKAKTAKKTSSAKNSKK